MNFKSQVPTREEWVAEAVIGDGDMMIFADDSKKECETGSGVFSKVCRSESTSNCWFRQTQHKWCEKLGRNRDRGVVMTNYVCKLNYLMTSSG